MYLITFFLFSMKNILWLAKTFLSVGKMASTVYEREIFSGLAGKAPSSDNCVVALSCELSFFWFVFCSVGMSPYFLFFFLSSKTISLSSNFTYDACVLWIHKSEISINS